MIYSLILREAGIVTKNRNRLYQLKPQFIADRDQRIVDLGWCLLRMNTSSSQPIRFFDKQVNRCSCKVVHSAVVAG